MVGLRHAGVLCIAFLCSVCTPACLTAATLRGVVTDSSEAPIARVNVTLISSAETGVTRVSTTTDVQGRFRFDDLAADTYRIVCVKKGWVRVERLWDATAMRSGEEGRVTLVMELTFFSQMVERIRLGVLAYVLVFGLLLLAANYWIAPQLSREANFVAWAVMAVSIAIACVKQQWVHAVLLAVVASALGTVIHKFGRKTADKRMQQAAEDRRIEAARQQDERERFQSLVGKEGIALTPLKPYGNASIDTQILEVKARHGFIPEQTARRGPRAGRQDADRRTLPVTVAGSGTPGLAACRTADYPTMSRRMAKCRQRKW